MKLYKIYIFIIFIFISACVFSTASAIKIDYLNKTSSLQPPPLDATSNVSGNKIPSYNQDQSGQNLPSSNLSPAGDQTNFKASDLKKTNANYSFLWWIIIFVAVFFIVIVVLYKIKRERTKDKKEQAF